MENKQLTIGVVGLIVGILLTAFVYPGWGYGARGNWGMMNSQRNMMTGGNVMGNIDQHFIEQMIPHHEDAIAMAKIALERSERAEILSLANGIIEAQEREIVEMREWYKEWFGREVPEGNAVSTPGHMMGGMMEGGMHGGMMGDTSDLLRLQNAGDFDKAFIEEMIPHHQMAVMMAQMLAASTSRSEMRELADQIITPQNREIEMMRDWYNTWYPES